VTSTQHNGICRSHSIDVRICHPNAKAVTQCNGCDVLQKDSSHDAIKEELTSISKARREELNYIYVDPSGNDGALEYFGLKSKDTPAFVIHDQGKDAKYVSKNIAAGSLGSWLDEFKVSRRNGVFPMSTCTVTYLACYPLTAVSSPQMLRRCVIAVRGAGMMSPGDHPGAGSAGWQPEEDHQERGRAGAQRRPGHDPNGQQLRRHCAAGQELHDRVLRPVVSCRIMCCLPYAEDAAALQCVMQICYVLPRSRGLPHGVL